MNLTGTDPDSIAVRFDSAGHVVQPVVLRNACEGEDCETRFAAMACVATSLRALPLDTSRVVVAVAEGDTVNVVRRDLRVSSPGLVVTRTSFALDHDMADGATGARSVPRADTARFARGDTVWVIRYLELGNWMWAHHRRIHYSDQFWASSPHPGFGEHSSDSSRAIARSEPESTDWWYVRTAHGATGWWKADSGALQSIYMMEHWGDDCATVRRRLREPSTPG